MNRVYDIRYTCTHAHVSLLNYDELRFLRKGSVFMASIRPERNIKGIKVLKNHAKTRYVLFTC